MRLKTLRAAWKNLYSLYVNNHYTCWYYENSSCPYHNNLCQNLFSSSAAEDEQLSDPEDTAMEERINPGPLQLLDGLSDPWSDLPHSDFLSLLLSSAYK